MRRGALRHEIDEGSVGRDAIHHRAMPESACRFPQDAFAYEVAQRLHNEKAASFQVAPKGLAPGATEADEQPAATGWNAEPALS